MQGAGGRDRLQAASDAAGFGLDLRARAGRPAGRPARRGRLDRLRPGRRLLLLLADADARSRHADARRSSRSRVEGTAWFDHQWGDFISVGGGGWDWFAINLDDGSDLTLSLVRDASGGYPLVYGTYVQPDGRTEHLGPDAFTVEPTGKLDEPEDRGDLPVGLARPSARARAST